MKSIQQFYIGTYTQPILFGTGEVMCGKGEGIYLAELDTQTGALTYQAVSAKTNNPSYLNFNKAQTHLYVVNELKEFLGEQGGGVCAFEVQSDKTLRFLNQQPTKGTDPCHLAVDPQESCVLVSNFMSGSIALYPILSDGTLDVCSCFIQHEGSGADEQRQAGPHAHSVLFEKTGNYVLVPDLGLDAILVYRLLRNSCQLELLFRYQSQPGSGPRYGEFHPTIPVCYFINELSSEVSVLRFASQTGELSHLQTVTTLEQPCVTENICADLHVTENGSNLYVSNRGCDSIVAYRIAADGTLHHLQTVPSGGKTPRNFALLTHDTFLVAANQDSNSLTSFFIDAQTGCLTAADNLSIPTPVCIRPFI